jgi:hypothetical protein
MVTVSENTNCRTGPSAAYDLVGALLIGESAKVVGKNTSTNYWIIENPDGNGFCWLWGRYASVTGNTDILPEMTPPPEPTATLVPTTVVPVSQANLVGGIVILDPASPTCSQTFTVGLDVTNQGPAQTTTSGTVSLVDARVADGHPQATTVGGFPSLMPGQTYRVNMPLTISTWYNETHRITLTIDLGDQIPESNESDNVRGVEYTLQRGSCP